MPAPLFWLGASALSLYAVAKYEKENQKYIATAPGESQVKVTPVDGAIVCCGVYEVFDHSGIWLEGNIVELKGSGLIRCISPERFLKDRSGEQIFVACDAFNNVLANDSIAMRAASRAFEYSEYDVLKNNCHRFVWQCIDEDKSDIVRFAELNRLMSLHFNEPIHWQPIDI